LGFVACLVVALAGCSAGGSGINVKGQVLLDGKALAGAHVVFEGPGGSSATTDSDGNFEIKSATKFDSIKPGKYFVYITKYVDKKGNAPDPEERDQLIAAKLLKNLVPAKYSDPESNVLTEEIKEGANNLAPFKLTSK
jgi:hypothetical protein